MTGSGWGQKGGFRADRIDLEIQSRLPCFIIYCLVIGLMRLLSKGSELSFVHDSVEWDESTNFKDYDIIFVNIQTLEKQAQKYDHPYNKSDNSPKLLDASDVSTFIKEDGYMVIYLPNSPVVNMGDTTTEKKKKNIARSQQFHQCKTPEEKEVEPYDEYKLLDWLPFSVNINTDESGESVVILEEGWDWYFRNYFSWDKLLNIPYNQSSYRSKSIVENSYSKNVAISVTSSYSSSNGYVALIPPTDSITYSEFVKGTLQNVFNIEVGVDGRAPPAWLSEYSLPSENEIEDNLQEKKDEIEELEEELESLTRFKKLLYETNTNLEEVVREALRELGFIVDEEVPGKRDGILHTTETKFVLEITGTTGGIKKNKSRQLDDWVENVIAENPDKDISGLLIVNPEMGTSPDERNIGIEPNVKRYMERRGDYKVFTTVDLYRLVKLSLKEGVDKEDIEAIFYQDDTLVSPSDELLE